MIWLNPGSLRMRAAAGREAKTTSSCVDHLAPRLGADDGISFLENDSFFAAMAPDQKRIDEELMEVTSKRVSVVRTT